MAGEVGEQVVETLPDIVATASVLLSQKKGDVKKVVDQIGGTLRARTWMVVGYATGLGVTVG